MRRINKAVLRMRIPPKWFANADKKTLELKRRYEETAGERAADARAWRTKWSEIVNDLKAVWQDKDLKQAMIDVSHGKCWYCEANVTQRGDVPIDHFRPKNSVAEDKTHDGYWWLACDWNNYRYACTYCNSRRNAGETTGGKQDQFPLWEEKHRARPPAFSTDGELPLLLDPLRPVDVALLTFDHAGVPVSRFSKEENPCAYERVRTSIETFHLHRGDFNAKRHEIMAKMAEHIEYAERQWRLFQDGRAHAWDAYCHALTTLLEYASSKAEFSAAARAYLGTMRGSSSVAETVFSLLD
jgi:hypothetical protein